LVAQREARLTDRNVTIARADGARAWLAERGVAAEFGGRALARVMSEHVKKPMAEELLFGKLAKGGTVKIGLDKKKDELTFKYIEEKPAKRKPKTPGKGAPEKV